MYLTEFNTQHTTQRCFTQPLLYLSHPPGEYLLSPTLPALLFTAESVRTAVTLPHLPVLFSFSPNTSTHPIAAVALAFLQLPFW